MYLRLESCQVRSIDAFGPDDKNVGYLVLHRDHTAYDIDTIINVKIRSRTTSYKPPISQTNADVAGHIKFQAINTTDCSTSKYLNRINSAVAVEDMDLCFYCNTFRGSSVAFTINSRQSIIVLEKNSTH